MDLFPVTGENENFLYPLISAFFVYFITLRVMMYLGIIAVYVAKL